MAQLYLSKVNYFLAADSCVSIVRGQLGLTIALKAPRVDLPLGLQADFGEGGEEQFAVVIVFKNVVALIAAIHDVVDVTGIFDSQWAGHGSTLSKARSSVNS